MYKKVKFLIAEYRNVTLGQQDAPRLRGFFANMDTSDYILHNHLKSGEDVYQYPRVQYKVICRHPMVVAFNEGIDSFYPRLMSANTLTLGDRTYIDPDLQIRLTTRPIGDCRTEHRYRFLTPWLALNQENYRRYMELAEDYGKEELLSRILTGNILSVCKAFGVTLEQRIHTTTSVHPIRVQFKGEAMIGFVGEFKSNVMLPTLCGIGKGVSIGMGTIKELKIVDQGE